MLDLDLRHSTAQYGVRELVIRILSIRERYTLFMVNEWVKCTWELTVKAMPPWTITVPHGVQNGGNSLVPFMTFGKSLRIVYKLWWQTFVLSTAAPCLTFGDIFTHGKGSEVGVECTNKT